MPVTEVGETEGATKGTREKFQTFHFELVKFKKPDTFKWGLQKRLQLAINLGIISISIVVKVMELDEFFF